MFVKPNYKRNFIMLEEANKTISSGKATGYLKEEIRDDKINIVVHVQNVDIKTDDNMLGIYLLSKEEKTIKPYYLGNVFIKNNKNGDAVFNMKKIVLEKKGVNIDKYDTVVVLKHDIARNDLSFYLVGFKNDSWNWEEEIKNTLISDVTQNTKKEGKGTDYKREEESSDEKIKTSEDNSKEKTLKNDMGEIEDNINDIIMVETENIKLKEMIGNVQEKYEETKVFSNKYPDCRWFKISDILFMTEDLFECYKNLSYIYNYDIHCAFYKYGHLLFGIELKGNNKIKNIYFGIPSKLGTESHPLLYVQQYANWVPKSADNPSVDEFGYWLIKINPQSEI